MLPADAQLVARDPDGLQADEATIVFAERLRFAVVLRQVRDVHDMGVWLGGARDEFTPLNLSDGADRGAWVGTLAVVEHARTLRLTGWTDAAGVWQRE